MGNNKEDCPICNEEFYPEYTYRILEEKVCNKCRAALEDVLSDIFEDSSARNQEKNINKGLLQLLIKHCRARTEKLIKSHREKIEENEKIIRSLKMYMAGIEKKWGDTENG